MGKTRLAGVGLFVIGGVILFGLGLFFIGDRRQLFDESFEITAEFSRLAGLQNGAEVRVAGLDAGEVVEIQYPVSPSHRFRVKMRIIEDLRPLVRADSLASIETDGLVGNKLIQIEAGSEEAEMVSDGELIRGRDPFELAELMQEARDTLGVIDDTVRAVQDDLSETAEQVEVAMERADATFQVVGENIRRMTDSGRVIAADVESMVADVRAGRGNLGKLVNDEALYHRAREAVDDLYRVAGDAEEVFANVKAITEDAQDAFEEFQSTAGPTPGFVADLRSTLQSAREATSDLAENMESMKRNFLFRGLFLERGFFDLDDLSLQEYMDGTLEAGNHRTLRIWMSASELFQLDERGEEVLTEGGKARLNAKLGEILRYPWNSPLVIEGYSATGSLDERYRREVRRAFVVRNYVVREFHRAPEYTGFIAMGEQEPAKVDAEGGEGIVLALYYDREGAPIPRHRAIH